VDSVTNIRSNVIRLHSVVAISATLDVPVFPCRPDKKPYTNNGFKNATHDPYQIIEWWKKWPDALIGMPTGAKSDYCILDVDIKKGIDGSATLHELENQHRKLPDTWVTLTPSGGLHYWFKTPGYHLQTSARKIGAGLDIRADGGYAIIPSSAGYEFEASNPAEVADMPEWLIELANQKKAGNKNNHGKEKSKKHLLIESINRKGKTFYPSLPRVNQLSNFPVGKYRAEFISWTVLEPGAYKLKSGQARIEMRFRVFVGDNHFYIGSFHTIDIYSVPALSGQMSTGRCSHLATCLNNVIGGMSSDGFPIQINLDDIDLECFADKQLIVTVELTKKRYAKVTDIDLHPLPP